MTDKEGTLGAAPVYKLSIAQLALIERFRHLIVDTEGHQVEELIQRPLVAFESFQSLATTQAVLYGQVCLLEALEAAGHLKKGPGA